MLQAQIHHKVPREFEGMEDVLTSSTIGLLSYLPDSLAAEVIAASSPQRAPLFRA